MAGIYGNSMEDRYMERQLNRYLDERDAAEQREEQLAEAAKDLMPAKIAQLPTTQPYGPHGVWTSCNLGDTLAEIKHVDFVPLARLLALPKPEQQDFVQIGRTLHDLVMKQLYKEALEEAEDLI